MVLVFGSFMCFYILSYSTLVLKCFTSGLSKQNEHFAQLQAFLLPHEMHADFVCVFTIGMFTPSISSLFIRLQTVSLVSFNCSIFITI